MNRGRGKKNRYQIILYPACEIHQPTQENGADFLFVTTYCNFWACHDHSELVSSDAVEFRSDLECCFEVS